MTTDTRGGVWENALEIASALGRCGLQVELAAFHGASDPTRSAEAERIANVRLHESPVRPDWMHDSDDTVRRAAAWLLALERELHPDVVHLNHLSLGAVPFTAPRLVVGHSCGLSRWRALRGGHEPPEWNGYRTRLARGLAGADMVVAPTHDSLRRLDALYGLSGPCTVIPNGCSAARFRPASFKEPYVLSVGGFWDEAKNLHALDEAAADLSWSVKVAGPLESSHGAPSAGPKRLALLGPLRRDQLAERYARASIYALPSRYEPFGLTVLEAALGGCALVLGDIPSLRESWDGAACFVDPDDPGALRRTVQSLIDDPVERLEVAFRGRARAIRSSPDRQAARYLEVYAGLVTDRRRRTADRPRAAPAERRQPARTSP